MTEINKIPKQVFDTFEADDHNFLVKVIIKDQAGNFKNQSIHVGTIEEVNRLIAPEHVVRHKVFIIGEKVPKVEAVRKLEAKEFVKMEAKQKRLAQYNEHKKEFESLPTVMEFVN